MLKWETASGANWEEMRLFLPDGLWSIIHDENDVFFRVTFSKKGTYFGDIRCVKKTRLEAQEYVKKTIVRSIEDEIDILQSLRKEVEGLYNKGKEK